MGLPTPGHAFDPQTASRLPWSVMRRRWRDRRETLPATRRRRRSHRRDVPRGTYYEPVPIYDAMARRGVQSRLRLAMMGMTAAVFCMVAVFVWPQTHFGVAALGAFGFCALNLAVAAILSARREEFVHRLASSMEDVPRLEEHGVDGSV